MGVIVRLLHLFCDIPLCEVIPVLITLFVQGVWAWNLDSLQRWVSLPDVQPWLGVLGLGWSNTIVVKSFQTPKMPVVQCRAFRWTFRRPYDAEPCTIRLYLVPAMSNRGFDALGAWFWLGEGCRLICTTTTTTTFPNPTIDLSSFFLLLADERIGSHNHSKGVVPFVSNW